MIITIANQKGGVGKTTTAVNLGGLLASSGYRVALLDLDTQGHIAPSLGLSRSPDIFNWLIKGMPLMDLAVSAPAAKSINNFKVIRGDKTTETAAKILGDKPFREYCIRDNLPVINPLDILIIDTPPANNLFQIAGLIAADIVLVPTLLDYLSMDGVTELMKTIAEINGHINTGGIRVAGIIPCFYDRVTNETRENIRLLIEWAGDLFVMPPIPKDTKFREAAAHGLPLHKYQSNSPGIVGYKMPGSFKRGRNRLGYYGGYVHIADLISELVR